MKIVDEKGKLFGKINLIDLLALIIIAAAVIFLAVRFLGGAGNNAINGATKLTYTAQVQAIDQATYDEVMRQMEQAGGKDQLMANGELLDPYVTKVEAVPHVSYNTDAAGNTVRSEENYDGGRWDLTFTVEANVADPVTSKLGTQEVRVGKSHILKTTHFEFSYSLIMTCDWG